MRIWILKKTKTTIIIKILSLDNTVYIKRWMDDGTEILLEKYKRIEITRHPYKVRSVKNENKRNKI